MFQATQKEPNLMFRFKDIPRKTLEECHEKATQVFGAGNYTIERVRDDA
jgi:hypothetical protein